MSVLVIAEHNNAQIKPETRSAITAAKALNEDVTVLVVGYECQTVADQVAAIAGVSKVLLADSDCFQNQLDINLAPLVKALSSPFSHLVCAATNFGKNLMPRAAALLDAAQVSDVVAIESSTVYKRPIYAGNAIATVESNQAITPMTIRVSSFEPTTGVQPAAPIEVTSLIFTAKGCELESESLSSNERPDLNAARVVVAGGRPFALQERFDLIEQLADKLKGAAGASRAAVDNGDIAYDLQIGQTGKVVAPELYIAVGISGAIQHVAGVMDSKVIVAINKDEEAPIFEIADYSLVADGYDAVAELIEAL